MEVILYAELYEGISLEGAILLARVIINDIGLTQSVQVKDQ